MMRLILMLFLLIVLLSLNTAQAEHSTNVISDSTVRAIDEPDCPQSHKSSDNNKRIKRLQIRNQAGLDGKVQKIHLEFDEEDKPGIHAYGLPKKSLQNNGIIERMHLGEDRIDDVLKNGRLVEAYGIPKNNMETNGFIERLSFPSADHQLATLRPRHENIRVRRSVRTGSENKIEKKITDETEDMEAQEGKVFRPLFVYRQQVAARERRKHARNAHRNHRHAIHQPCYH
ncbi:uncharacterized protein LOC105259120 [Camponotus floridanus]|uniref:uncharacterized protein LOC105259120 n=1 Tax=Camponotus floridanus TaxID=104421 RepID=UPI00059B6B2D|nr:uncharacterized protein LOC105259120 [Camponotus floridanus]